MPILNPDDPRLGSAAPMFLPFLQADDLWIFTVRDRQSKNGDFRAAIRKGDKHVITLNHGLGKDAFLLILAHEIAHYQVFKQFGRQSKPHGPAWKSSFRNLLYPLIRSGALTSSIIELVGHHALNPRASLSADKELWIAVNGKRMQDGHVTLESIPEGSVFMLNRRRVFRKMQKRRTRFTCLELSNQRIYLISGHAPVKVLEP